MKFLVQCDFTVYLWRWVCQIYWTWCCLIAELGCELVWQPLFGVLSAFCRLFKLIPFISGRFCSWVLYSGCLGCSWWKSLKLSNQIDDGSKTSAIWQTVELPWKKRKKWNLTLLFLCVNCKGVCVVLLLYNHVHSFSLIRNKTLLVRIRRNYTAVDKKITLKETSWKLKAHRREQS